MITENIWRFYVAKCQDARIRAETRAHNYARANFKNAYNGLKRVPKKFETN